MYKIRILRYVGIINDCEHVSCLPEILSKINVS